jgi:glycosyltransferase involved in cell wall biosynthesis
VLLAITKGEVGGAQEHLRLLALGLLDAGHEVGIAVRDPSELATSLRPAGAKILPWESIEGNLNPLADRKARAELARIVDSWSPQILHLNSSKAGTIGVGLLRPPRGVTIFTCHHAPFGPGRKTVNRLVARPAMKLVLPRIEGIISVGDRDVPALRHLAPHVPIEVIANGTAPPEQPDSSGPMRTVALWVARMAHPKDPLRVVDAWPTVVARHPGARLLLCGTGPLSAPVDAAVLGSSVGEQIAAVGFAADLSMYRRQASVFVLSTRVEGGLTMATLESMAHGLVPVVSDAGDAHLLEDLKMGIRVRGRSPASFGEAVADLFDDPEHYDALRTNALRYSGSDRTTEHVVAETLGFYQRILVQANIRQDGRR